MAGRVVTLAQAEQQVARAVDQLETVHWQLLGIALSLPEPAAEENQEDLGEQAGAEAELRRVVECVLADRIRLALNDLRTFLARTEARGEKP